MQQIGQRVFVMHVGRRHHGAVRQPALAVHANVQLHAEIPLLAFACLVHIGVARLVGVLGGELGAAMMVASTMVPVLTLKPRSCNCWPTFGKQGFAQFLLAGAVCETSAAWWRRARVHAQVNARKAAQTGTVIQSLLARQIGQVEPVLKKWMRSMRSTNGRAAVACLG